MEWIQAYDPLHHVWLSTLAVSVGLYGMPPATALGAAPGQEGQILHFGSWHSLARVTIVGISVMLQAYVFTWMVPAWP